MNPLLSFMLFLLSVPLAWAEEPTEQEEVPLTIEYPEARMGDVVDTYHGVDVADPYRWLEDPNSEETRTWVDKQVALTSGWLHGIPRRAWVKERLQKLWNYERFSSPSKKGGRYFFRHNNGLQDHSVLYTSDRLDGPASLVLDPNTLSKDGTVSLGFTSLSEDGSLLAYGTSDGGSDWVTIHIRDVLSQRDLTETLEWVKFSGASWTHDNNGFFYSRYPAPDNKLESVNENQKLYYHQIGTPQEHDRLIYESPDRPKRGWGSSVSESGDTLFIYGWEGTGERNTLYTLDLRTENAEVVKLMDAFDASYSVLGERIYTDDRNWLQRLFGPSLQPPETRYWIQTNKDAPNGRIFSMNPERPQEQYWTEVVPESKHVLRGASLVGDHLVLSYLEDAQSTVKVFDLDGVFVRDVALPGIGTAYGFGGKSDDPETFFTFTGFTDPATIFQYDISTGTTSKWKQPEVDFDPDAFETRQVFFTSKDGTRVPMFIMHKKGIDLDGAVPTLLYGYGGFNVSLTPGFSLSRLIWMEMGGVYAIANLRGGGEYGEEWHKAGTKMNKQNVFDDFISAAEYLIEEGYTKPEKLAINGGSNGGLLVGAAMTQRPALFGAAIPAVGVLDMLRYHEFTIGWAWADDYGTSADSPEMFEYLQAYSPVHNLKAGVRYPTTMVTTADHDDRVVPAHSYKFAATLQHAHEGENPVLIRIEKRAGHGRGTPISKRIEQVADQYAFLVRALGMETEEELGVEKEGENTNDTENVEADQEDAAK